MAERGNAPNIALVSLLAGLTGAGIALLFAPRSGKETRQKLQTSAEDLKQRAEDGVQNAKKTVESTRNSLSDALHNTARKAKERYETSLDDMSETDDTTAHPSKQSPILRAWEEEV